jgi:hypothetical protein
LSEGYPTLADIDSLLTRTKKAREEPVRELNWLTIPGELFAALILDGYPGALRIASETARPKVLGYRNKVDKPKYTIP